ncbi:MAG: polymerase primary sigma factor [Solirubrobacteraceae bacterium]|nr:polymerase primary sigma factor [Solirubrobacteraceae bacterium]
MTAHSAVAHVPASRSTPISPAPPEVGEIRSQLTAFHESQSELVRAARRNRPYARARLVESFMPLIGSIARIYAHAPTVDRSELMQEGVVGMLRALERYDPDLGTPFWAYASWWVRQAMQQVVSELSRPVVLSDRALRQLAHVREARRSFARAHAREPSVQELAAASELTLEQLQRLSMAERPPRGLQEPIDDTTGGGGATFGDTLRDPRAEEAYEELGIRMGAAEVPRLLEQLSDRERGVVEGRYGLLSQELTLRELGETMGISAERVRQIEQIALEKMRAAYSQPASEQSAPSFRRPRSCGPRDPARRPARRLHPSSGPRARRPQRRP